MHTSLCKLDVNWNSQEYPAQPGLPISKLTNKEPTTKECNPLLDLIKVHEWLVQKINDPAHAFAQDWGTDIVVSYYCIGGAVQSNRMRKY